VRSFITTQDVACLYASFVLATFKKAARH